MLPVQVLMSLCTLVVLVTDEKAVRIAKEFAHPTGPGGRCDRFASTVFTAWVDNVGCEGTIRRADGVQRRVTVLVLATVEELEEVLRSNTALHLHSSRGNFGYTFTRAKMSPQPHHTYPACQTGTRLSSANSINSVLHMVFTGGASK